MARYEVGGGVSNSEQLKPQQDGASYEGLEGDAFFEKYQRDREEMERKDGARRLAELDANIKRLTDTISRLDGQRNPSPVLPTLKAEKDALIRKKIEMTNGNQLQDAVTTPEEDKQDVIERYKKGEATDAELLATTERGFRNEKPQVHGTYMYEELFHENIDGDTIFTFPEDIITAMGLNVGDEVAISAVDGNLVIKKI